MDRRQLLLALLSTPLTAGLRAPAEPVEPIVGLPCEGCEAAFDGRPYTLPTHARIALPGESGDPLHLEGRVADRYGHARSGVIVYAYHTDRKGIYPPGDALTREARRHGRLRAWVRTDAEGMYRFQSIRPGSYPGRDVPEHIHMHVIEPGRFTYYIDDLVFTDDPKLTTAYIRDHDAGRGGSGIASPQRRDGVWQVRRDITLGLRIPGHPDSSLG